MKFILMMQFPLGDWKTKGGGLACARRQGAHGFPAPFQQGANRGRRVRAD